MRRRSAGFTLAEFLIVNGLAGMVVAGAFILQASFHNQSRRQQQISEVQQTLRLAMLILERSIRTSGSGMVGGQMTLNANACAGAPINYYGFQFSDRNVYPQVAFVSASGGNDTDPDWFRVIAADSTAPNLAGSDTGTSTTVVGSLASWSVGQLFLVINPPPKASCLREATSVAGSAVGHASPGVNYPCSNPSPDPCVAATGFAAPVSHFINEMLFRVFPATSASDSPKLALRQAPIGNIDTAAFPWTIITDNIEDMQIAMLMRDGRVCFDVDDPVVCNPTQLAAVRVTLVGRTPTIVAGAPPSQTGGYEDEGAVAVNDGYLRRAITAEIQLRNW